MSGREPLLRSHKSNTRASLRLQFPDRGVGLVCTRATEMNESEKC